MRDLPSRPVSDDWAETLIGRLPTLETGAAGVHVRTLQGLLRARGHDMAIDGAFGDVTRLGVQSEQAGHGLNADGVVDSHTWAVLISGRPL